VADSRGREMMISCGAALFTARLALRSLGYVPQTSVLPDPGEPLLVARVSWQRRAAAAEYKQRLYSQVRRRRTHRGGFDPVPIPLDLVAMLQEGAERDGRCSRITCSAGNRAVLAAAVETAEQSLELDSMYARELASWATPTGQYPARWGAAYRLLRAA
jgi:cytochrome P450